MEPRRRLLTEGVLIVASILMAFALDAAWDGAREMRSLEERLGQLQRQLDRNRSEAEQAIDRNQVLLSRLERFLRGSPADLADLPGDSLGPIVEAFLWAAYYSQNGGLVESLVASGDLERLEDNELRDRLTSWSTIPAELDEDEELVTQANGRLAGAISGHGVSTAVFSERGGVPVWGNPGFETAISAMRRDQEAVGLVAYKYFVLRSYVGNLRAILESFARIESQLAAY